MGVVVSRDAGQLRACEWQQLVDDFADLVLRRHGVAGSIAGRYSLYAALEDEWERARATCIRVGPSSVVGGQHEHEHQS